MTGEEKICGHLSKRNSGFKALKKVYDCELLKSNFFENFISPFVTASLSRKVTLTIHAVHFSCFETVNVSMKKIRRRTEEKN